MATKKLVEQYARSFPSKLRSSTGMRTIGRESEYPVVEADGTAGDVQRLLRRLAAQNESNLSTVMDFANGDSSRISSVKNNAVDYTIEVGTGTVELIHCPHDDLLALEQSHMQALDLLYTAAGAEGLRILGCGIQPLTPPSLELMTKRKRYGFLHDILGYGWELFSATASEQIHVSITAKEMPKVTSACNGATGAIIALCGNSGILNGSLSQHVNTREMGKGTLGHRHGMSSGPVASMKEYLDQIVEYDYLMTPPRDSSGPRLALVSPITKEEPKPSFLPFKHHWNQDVASYDPEFLFHDHYVWHSARPRPKQATIEIRPACQQPLNQQDQQVVGALSVGIVENHAEVYDFLRTFGRKQESKKESLPTLTEAWPELKRLHNKAGASGLEDAEVRKLSQGVLELAQKGLQMRGLGEERLLQPLFKRIDDSSNPSQTSRDFFTKNNNDITKTVDFLAQR